MPESMHQRTLIRLAVIKLLKESQDLATLLGDRVYANKLDGWQPDDLPACGVYTLQEDNLEPVTSPGRPERLLRLGIDLAALPGEGFDDQLDTLAFIVEKTLHLPQIGEAMGRIFNQRLLEAGLPAQEKRLVDGEMRWPADTLLLLRLTGTTVNVSSDSEIRIGVATLNFDLEYQDRPADSALDDFLYAHGNWNAESAEGVLEMESRVEYEAPE